MSGLYGSIPQDRLDHYLGVAEQVITEATEPVAQALGSVVVRSAENLNVSWSADGLVSAAEELARVYAYEMEDVAYRAMVYLRENNLHDNFMREMLEASAQTAEDAEYHLRVVDARRRIGSEENPFLRHDYNSRALPSLKPTYGITHLSDNEHRALSELDNPIG